MKSLIIDRRVRRDCVYVNCLHMRKLEGCTNTRICFHDYIEDKPIASDMGNPKKPSLSSV
jgi:hypothetical protein